MLVTPSPLLVGTPPPAATSWGPRGDALCGCGKLRGASGGSPGAPGAPQELGMDLPRAGRVRSVSCSWGEGLLAPRGAGGRRGDALLLPRLCAEASSAREIGRW